eukprot:1157801-Pelagomonas_calceolata.AAC.2
MASTETQTCQAQAIGIMAHVQMIQIRLGTMNTKQLLEHTLSIIILAAGVDGRDALRGEDQRPSTRVSQEGGGDALWRRGPLAHAASQIGRGPFHMLAVIVPGFTGHIHEMKLGHHEGEWLCSLHWSPTTPNQG